MMMMMMILVLMMMVLVMIRVFDTWLRAVMQQTVSADPLGTGTRSAKTEERRR